MTLDEVMRLLAAAKAAYGDRFAVGEDTIAVWHDMTQDLGGTEALAALRSHIATEQFPPTIAGIRKLAAKKLANVPDWEQAWDEVQRKIGSVGRYRVPTFSHPAITAAVDCIGWIALCDCEGDGLSTLRAQFRDVYNGYKGRTLEAANQGRLEAHVARTGETIGAGDAVTRLLEAVPRPK